MTREIPLTRGYVVLVDDEDYERASTFKWCAYISRNTVYAVRSLPRSQGHGTAYLHNLIMDTPRGFIVDHIDSNALNCQRSNMRLCTPAQNTRNSRIPSHNTSGFKGVSWHSPARKWCAKIQFNKKTLYIGIYEDIKEAARAYDTKARTLFGEFARVNFPE